MDYAKSKARVDRWKEEVELVLEEMCRTLTYLRWKGDWWGRQSKQTQDNLDDDLRMGLESHACRQQHQLILLMRSFASQWIPVLRANGLDPSNMIGEECGSAGDVLVVEHNIALGGGAELGDVDSGGMQSHICEDVY